MDGQPERWYVYRIPGSPRGFGYILSRAKELPQRKEKAPPLPLIWEGEARDADHALEQAKQCELESPLRESLPT